MKFATKLRAIIEINVSVETANLPSECRPQVSESQSTKRTTLRRADIKKSSFGSGSQTGKESFRVTVKQEPPITVGVPTASPEIAMYITSSLLSEISHIQKNLERSTKELIAILRDEARIKRTELEVPEVLYKEYMDALASGEDLGAAFAKLYCEEFAFDKNKIIRKLAQRFESGIRERVNPSGTKRERSEESLRGYQHVAKDKLRKQLIKLLRQGERPKKTVVARQMRIGSDSSNRTASMNHWLKVNGLNWREELAEVKKQIKT